MRKTKVCVGTRGRLGHHSVGRAGLLPIFLGAATGAILGVAPAAPAQGLSVELSTGLQVPVGDMARHRSVGPRISGGLRYDFTGSPWALRAELSAGALRGEPQDPDGYPDWQRGDLPSVGIALAGMRAFGTGQTRPYMLFGAGGYRMQIEGVSRNPYGTIGALFAGGGLEREMGPWRLFAETRAKITLSDYGSQEFSPGIQFPTVIGVGRAIPSPDIVAALREGSGRPAVVPWAPDRSRLLTVPSGRGLGAGAVQLAVTAPWTPFVAFGMVEDNLLFLRPSIALGLTDWLSMHGGFWPQAIPTDLRSPVHQDGQIFGGAEVTLPLGNWSVSGGAHLTHPRGNEFGRTISESVFYGAAYRETARGGYTLGAGWRGFPTGGDQRGWTGGGFLMGGIQRSLFPNLEAVAEGYIGDGSIAVRPGLRTGVLGLSLEASYGCALYAGMGIGGRCEGPNVTAAYRFELPGRP